MSLPPLTTVYCLDFPENWLLGIDFFYFQSTPQFKGVKLIPPGTHTFHWGIDTDNARNGKFFTGTQNESKLLILQWDNVNEKVLMEADIGELEVSAIKSRLGESYHLMIVYEELKRATIDRAQGDFVQAPWPALTCYLTELIYERILPPYQIASSLLTTAHENNILRQSLYDAAKDRAAKHRAASDKEVADDKIIQSLVDQSDSELKFTEINFKARMAEPTLTGRNLTNLYLDKSWYLSELLHTLHPAGFKAFLGEFQFAFLLFVIFGNFSAALQWLNMVQLIFDCESAFVSHAQHSISFLRVLKDHLEVCPPEYLTQFWDQTELVKVMLQFHENVYGQEPWNICLPTLDSLCEEIFCICEEKLNISFPKHSEYLAELDDNSEDGPEIVE